MVWCWEVVMWVVREEIRDLAAIPKKSKWNELNSFKFDDLPN